jgi:hypothetical protein
LRCFTCRGAGSPVPRALAAWTQVEDGQVAEYQVNMEVTFVLKD